MGAHVRSLTATQGSHIQRTLRQSSNAVAVRRAQVVLLSEQGSTVQEIAEQTFLHEEYVRELIRRFNKQGLAMLKERPKSGRPLDFGEEIQAEIVEIALAPPKLLGRPFTVWSLEKLKEYLIETKVVKTISHETLRSILHQRGIRLKRTKTWKESNDPAFEAKKNG